MKYDLILLPTETTVSYHLYFKPASEFLNFCSERYMIPHLMTVNYARTKSLWKIYYESENDLIDLILAYK